MVDLIAWDSCIIIDAIQKNPTVYPHLQPIIRQAEAGQLKIVVSTISITEVKYLRELSANGLSQEEQNGLIEAWFNEPYVIKRNADYATCKEAASLAQLAASTKRNLKTADSIVLATAIRAGVSTLLTLDDGNDSSVGLLELDGRFGTPALQIRRPDQMAGQMELGIDGRLKEGSKASERAL